jgi:hypothetical protein
MSTDERRRHQRVRIDGAMSGRATVMANFRVEDLSETGASLEMQIPLSLSSECILSLNLAHAPVEVQGTVTRVAPKEGTDGLYRVNVDFHDVETIDQGLLQSFLERERRRNA